MSTATEAPQITYTEAYNRVQALYHAGLITAHERINKTTQLDDIRFGYESNSPHSQQRMADIALA